jgi:hypothetical protein
MPRYFFHVQDGLSEPDEAGTVLPDIRAAKRYALRYASSLVAEVGDDFWDRDEWRLVVTDERGLTLFTIAVLLWDAAALGGSKRT